jgi:hypothetical protein
MLAAPFLLSTAITGTKIIAFIVIVLIVTLGYWFFRGRSRSA